MNGSIGIIFPNPVPNVRTQAFLDAGNVYYDGRPAFGGGSSGPLRFASGVEVDWRSPLGPLTFSLAGALNDKPQDSTKYFQFSIGTSF